MSFPISKEMKAFTNFLYENDINDGNVDVIHPPSKESTESIETHCKRVSTDFANKICEAIRVDILTKKLEYPNLDEMMKKYNSMLYEQFYEDIKARDYGYYI